MLFSDWRRNEQEREMSLALEKVAKEVGAKSFTLGNFRAPTSLSLTQLLLSVSIRHHLCDAKGAFCLPHCGWT